MNCENSEVLPPGSVSVKARNSAAGTTVFTVIAIAVLGVVLASGPELSGEGRGGLEPLLLAGVAALGFGGVFVLIAEGTSSGTFGSVVMTLLTMRLVPPARLLPVMLTEHDQDLAHLGGFLTSAASARHAMDEPIRARL